MIAENFLTKILTILKPLDNSNLSVRDLRKKIEQDPAMKSHFDNLGKDAEIIRKAAKKRRRDDKSFDVIYGLMNSYLDK